MSHEKNAVVQVVEADARIKGSNSHDELEMSRMGKTQELLVSRVPYQARTHTHVDAQRTFRFISIIGFVTILQSSWESVLLANSYGLFNGGTAGVIWVTIIVWLCMLALIASM